MRFVFTGACPGLTRDELMASCRTLFQGLHRIENSVTRHTDVLVASDEALATVNRKVVVARKFLVPIWSYSTFLRFLQDGDAIRARQEAFGERGIPERTVEVSARLHPSSPAFTPPVRPITASRGLKRNL